jgi:hypothetical protein
METVINGLSAEGLCRVLQEIGFRAELRVTSDGVSIIRSSTSGWNFIIIPVKTASETAYSTCLISSGLSDVRVTPTFTNRWNAQYRYTKAFADSESNPILEMDMFLSGVTIGYMRRCLAIWDLFLPKYFEAASADVA